MTFKDPAFGDTIEGGGGDAPAELSMGEHSETRRVGDADASAARARFLEALASPARLEVVEGLQVVGPSSVAELARRLGRAADSLYYHLRELERAGVVEVCGRTPAPRGHGGRRGAIYRIAAEVVGGDMAAGDEGGDGDSARERAALGAMASAILRLTERNVGLSLTGPAPRRPGPGFEDLPHVQRTKAWLTAEELDELGTLVARVEDFLRARAEPGPGDRSLCALTFALTTVPDNAS